MIRFEDVSVTLADTEVLSEVSLSVTEGQFLALVGPNGAGKTTLLRTCNGLVAPTTGRVTVDGEDVGALSARDLGKRVATVPQETTLGFDFAVEDLVMMGRTPHRSRFDRTDDADRAAVESAMERTAVRQFAERPVGELSGGERQRVLLARALAQDTHVVLLDEPTANLDINHQVETLSLARELADEGRTVVAAIHDLELAARFCDAVALLAEGQVLAHGPPAEVLAVEGLEAAFDVRVAVGVNPATGTPSVTPLSDAPPGERRVHVVGTGEDAARVLGTLADAGIELTVGVLPEDDAALAVARSVARDVVRAEPFGSVPDAERAAAADLVADADLTVVVGDSGGANAAIVRETDRSIGVAGTDPPPDLPTVPEDELIQAVDTPPTGHLDRSGAGPQRGPPEIDERG